MSNNIRIETVENGFVVCTDDEGRGYRGAIAGRFAFETFESLTAWLAQNLTKPKSVAEGGQSQST